MLNPKQETKFNKLLGILTARLVVLWREILKQTMKALLPIVLLSLTTSTFAQENDTEKKELKAIFIKTDDMEMPVMQGDHILFEKGMKWHDKGEEKLTAEQKATLMTKQMTLHLSLDEGQERKVGKVNAKHHEQMESLKDLKGYEKKKRIWMHKLSTSVNFKKYFQRSNSHSLKKCIRTKEAKCI